MKTIEQVRRLRLGMLKEEFVSWVALNEKLGAPSRDSTLSQCMNQSQGSKSKSPKTMGSDLARRLERVCDKPEGWMDTDPALEGGTWPFTNELHERFLRMDSGELRRIENIIRASFEMPQLPRPEADAPHAPDKRTGTNG